MVSRAKWLRWIAAKEGSVPIIIMGRAVNTYDLEELRAAIGFLHRMLLWASAEDLLEDEDITRVRPSDRQ